MIKAVSRKPLIRRKVHNSLGKLKVKRVGSYGGTSKGGKPKIWKLKRADTEFRQYMLKSVPIQCVFPDCPVVNPKKLTVSHYFGRVNKGTRYDIRNCDLICRNHHYWDKQLGWEFQKQVLAKHGWNGKYTEYMLGKLGLKGYLELQELAESGTKQKVAILKFQQSLQ